MLFVFSPCIGVLRGTRYINILSAVLSLPTHRQYYTRHYTPKITVMLSSILLAAILALSVTGLPHGLPSDGGVRITSTPVAAAGSLDMFGLTACSFLLFPPSELMLLTFLCVHQMTMTRLHDLSLPVSCWPHSFVLGIGLNVVGRNGFSWMSS